MVYERATTSPEAERFDATPTVNPISVFSGTSSGNPRHGRACVIEILPMYMASPEESERGYCSVGTYF